MNPENVPLNGPALLVANHLSFIDGLLVGSCVQRFVRFMVYAPFFKMPLLGKLFTLMRAIPTGGGGARGALGAIKRAREELQAGHVVCIFAEGAISRTGNMLPFKRGFEKIVDGLDVPVIPVHLDQVWGSIFSFKDGKFFWKWPVRLLLSGHHHLRQTAAGDGARLGRAAEAAGDGRRCLPPPAQEGRPGASPLRRAGQAFLAPLRDDGFARPDRRPSARR